MMKLTQTTADEGVEKLYRVFGKYWTFGRNDVDVRSRDQ